jgi:glycosyltransferase involved in cell wall biosynthesis
MMKSLGVPAERINLTPYSVDNAWWKAESAKVNRAAVRAQWGATSEQPVILFCAKLQPWKRPMDLLDAFADAALPESLLLFAGGGPQRAELETAAANRGIRQRVKFLGFVNQTQLPALYSAADVMVLPSSYEPFAVVVNEAMCCGCPVIVSDQAGAARDLIAPVRPDFVFPVGNTQALARALQSAFADREKLRDTGRRGFAYVESHSPERLVAATLEAIRKAVQVVRREKS